MSLGLPCIGTRVAGIPELIEHEVTGLLVDAEDTNALSDALTRLIANEAERKAFGVLGREKFEREYSEQALISKLALILDDLATGSRSCAASEVAKNAA